MPIPILQSVSRALIFFVANALTTKVAQFALDQLRKIHHVTHFCYVHVQFFTTTMPIL
jgi:hypothetical protein